MTKKQIDDALQNVKITEDFYNVKLTDEYIEILLDELSSICLENDDFIVAEYYEESQWFLISFGKSDEEIIRFKIED